MLQLRMRKQINHAYVCQWRLVLIEVRVEVRDCAKFVKVVIEKFRIDL